MDYENPIDQQLAIKLPKELVQEWKYLVLKRQEIEGHSVDPVEVLRQAIATEVYIWQQKPTQQRSVKQRRSTRAEDV